MSQPYPLRNLLRDDIVVDGLDRDEVLAAAPEWRTTASASPRSSGSSRARASPTPSVRDGDRRTTPKLSSASRTPARSSSARPTSTSSRWAPAQRTPRSGRPATPRRVPRAGRVEWRQFGSCRRRIRHGRLRQRHRRLIRQPAALCGAVGVKPIYGGVSRRGLIAFASSLDQIGPFTASVADAAAVLEVIGGHDPGDSTSIPQPPRSSQRRHARVGGTR